MSMSPESGESTDDAVASSPLDFDLVAIDMYLMHILSRQSSSSTPTPCSSTPESADEPTYECTDCGKTLSSTSLRERTQDPHRRLVHNEVQFSNCGITDDKWKCNFCPKTFDTPKNLSYHNKFECRMRLRVNKFRCTFCHREFNQKCKLTQHLDNKHRRPMDYWNKLLAEEN
ncbi:uncharacterized protein LOC143905290 [Temnothorax americanus]|uniref:uncharacterized protein LOC143905290 n=1 Tax=Temnothorax americanus TaxID=1964332 RepID=UPI004068E2D4